MPRLHHIQVLPPLKRVCLQGSSRPSPSSSHHQLQVQPRKPRRRHRLAPHLETVVLPSSYIFFFSPSIRPRNSLFFSTSSAYSIHFNLNPTEAVNMSLSSKLSITDVDVKDKRVLIRVS